MLLDDLLQKTGLKYEDLTIAERETLHTWVESLQKNQLTLNKVKEYIDSMRDSVEKELTTTSFGSKQDLFLKARLRNYMMIEAFLSSPQKAKEALDRALSGLVGSRK